MAMTINDLLNIINSAADKPQATEYSKDLYLKAEVGGSKEDIQMIGASNAVILQQRIDAFKDCCCDRGAQIIAIEIKGNSGDWIALVKIKITDSYYYRVGMREYKDWVNAH